MKEVLPFCPGLTIFAVCCQFPLKEGKFLMWSVTDNTPTVVSSYQLKDSIATTAPTVFVIMSIHCSTCYKTA